MRQAIPLLKWFWWRHRVLLSVSVISVLLAQLAYWSAVAWEVSEESMPPVATFLHISFLTAFGCALTVFAHGAELDLTSGRSSLPRWLQQLPVRNGLLALVPMTAMVIALTWAWIPYQMAMLHFYDSQSRVATFSGPGHFHYLVLVPLLFFFVLGIWLQATSWFPFRFAIFRAFTIFGIGYVLIYSINRIFEPLRETLRESRDYRSLLDVLTTEGSWQLNALAIGSILLGVFATISSVSFARQRATLAESDWSGGIWNGISSFISRTIQTISPQHAEQQTRFENETEALRWRDWKQLGRFPCWIMIGFALWAVFYKLGLILFPIAIMVCGFAGSTLGKNRYWKGSKPLSPFLGTLPVSNDTFLRMRIFNSFRVSMVCCGIAGAGFLISILAPSSRAALLVLVDILSENWEFDPKYGINVLGAFFLLGLYLTIVAPLPGMVVGLSGRRMIHLATNIILGVGTVASWLGLAVGLAYLSRKLQSSEFANNPGMLQDYVDRLFFQIFLALCMVLAVKVLLSAVAIGLQVRRGIFRWQPILKYGPALAVCYVILTGCFWFLLHDTGLDLHWLMVVLAILVPFPSLLMAPVSLDWNRHR